MPRVRLIIPACNEAASIEAALLSHLATDYPAVNARQHVALHFSRTLDDLKRSFEKCGFAIVGRYSLARLTGFALSLPVLELGPFTGLMPAGGGVQLCVHPAFGIPGLAER